jgi:uncharacterized protein (DUF433 family)
MEHISSHDTHVTPRPVEHIVSTPGTCGGKPRIAGTRIRVQDVVVWHEAWGLSPEEIVTDFPQLTLAQVHAALAYYYEYRKNKAPLHVPPRAGVSPHRAPSSCPHQRRASAGGRQPGRDHARRAPRRRHAPARNNADWCRRLR